ncbi:hypothetical protein VaNZ11_015419 [Volvox africanus]|uniref:t-SNARE coiled-coil homology domain-containing protein n=1 Tax=Volvox africanus TaxID=51714 RepID=A0ABQ5SLG3_9CHLO|nr:hypothetical protein VaNZ11_015419 [Volvox africanus]
MDDGLCGARSMYIDLPLPCGLGTLGTRRHFRPEVIQSPADAKASRDLEHWLMQQRSADPAECRDDDCALTTSSMTIADERSRNLLYAEHDEFSSEARPSASEIAAAMVAAGTLSRNARLMLSSNHRIGKRSQSPFLSARPHETLPRRQHASGGTGASSRSTSPGWGWPATASRESYKAPAISAGVPISAVAAGAASTSKTRFRASPQRRLSSRRSNSAVKNSDDALGGARAVSPWSCGSDIRPSSAAKLTTVMATRGPASCGAAAPRARSTGRQRKNLLDELKAPLQTPRGAAAAPLSAGRQRPSPSRRVYPRTPVPHGVVCPLGGLAGDGAASRSTSPSAHNLHAPSVCASSTTKAASSRDSVATAVVTPACSCDPRLMSLLGLDAELPSFTNEGYDKAADLNAAHPNTEMLVKPTTPLATWLASSLAAADADSGNACNHIGGGFQTDALLHQLSSYPTSSALRIACVQDGPVVSTAVTNPYPEPGSSEIGKFGAPETHVPAIAAPALVASPRACTLGDLDPKSALVVAPNGGALLDPDFVAVSELSHDGQAAAAPEPASCSGNYRSSTYLVDPAQVHTHVPQEVVSAIISTAEPLSPTILAAVAAVSGAKSLPQSPGVEPAAHLLAFGNLDAHGSASDALVRQLVAIVQSQATQIKDLHEYLAAERLGGVRNTSSQNCERSSSGVGVSVLPPLGKLEGRKALAPAGAATGHTERKEPDSVTRKAAIRSSAGQLVPLSSNSTQYHDSVGSMRSSREVPALSVAVGEDQDGTEGVLRDSMLGCNASLGLREHSQRDGIDVGATAAGTEWHDNAGYNADGAGSSAPVVIDGWWISYGCSSGTGEFAGAHQSSQLTPAVAAAEGPGGFAPGAVGGQQGIPMQSPDGKAGEVRASAVSAFQEAGDHWREGNDHRQQQQQQQEEEPAKRQHLWEQQQLQMQQQMQPLPFGLCQACEHDPHEQGRGSREKQEDRIAAHYGQRRVETQTLEVDSLDEIRQSSDEALPGNRGHQVQRSSIHEGQRSERQVQHQEQEREHGPRLPQDVRDSPPLGPSWSVVAEASLRSEVTELRQRLAQLEAAATQQQLMLYKGSGRDQNQRETKGKSQGHGQWQERPFQQQEDANGATAHHANQEMQSGLQSEVQMEQGQRMDVSACDGELVRITQEQELWLSSLPDQLPSVQQGLRRQEEGKRAALEPLSKGMEHAPPCMVSAIPPHLDAAVRAAGAAAASPSQLSNNVMSQLFPLGSASESMATSGASSPTSAAASAAFRPHSVTSAATASAAAMVSHPRPCAQTPSGGQPDSPLPYGVRRQMRSLQQEMRHMQAVMVGHVFAAAAARAGGGGGAGGGGRPTCASSLQLYSQRDWKLQMQHQVWQEELQEQVRQLRQEISELRNGEALVVEAQEALMDLINDMRRDLDELRKNLPYSGLITLRADIAGGTSGQRAHAAPAPSAIDASSVSRKRSSGSHQEAGSAAVLDFSSQEVEQVHDSQSGSLQALQLQPNQVSEMVAVIQSVNSMLNGSLSQAISKIQVQGEEIEELKRCMARVTSGHAWL